MKKFFFKICNLWFKFPQIVRFIFVGGFNTLLSYAIFCLLIYFFTDEWRQICLIVQWILTSYISYIFQRVFVFQSQGNMKKEYIKCCVAWGVGYFANALTLEVFYQFGMNVYLAQLLGQITAAFVSYFFFKYWALKKDKR